MHGHIRCQFNTGTNKFPQNKSQLILSSTFCFKYLYISCYQFFLVLHAYIQGALSLANPFQVD